MGVVCTFVYVWKGNDDSLDVCKWVSCVRLFTYGNVTMTVWMCVSGCRVYVCLRMEM